MCDNIMFGVAGIDALKLGLAPKLELCMSVENTETQRSTVACVCQIEFNKLYVFTMHL